MPRISETFEEMFRNRFGRAPTQEELTILIDQSVKSYNQSGGITAHTVNFGRQPRKLNDSLKRETLTNIPRELPITVTAVMGDAEAMQYAQEIYDFLKENGFPLVENGISQAVYSTPTKGLIFEISTSTVIVGTNMA